jgi:prepilin-type N-terminal cleavage/methylation domain-containing protein
MKQQNNSGFSLIEVIIAMAIFAIGSLGLYGMQFNSARWNTRANQQSNAVAVASQVVEHLMRTDYSHSALNPEVTPHNADELDDLTFAYGDPGPDGLIKSVQWTVTQVTDDIKQVDVAVEYGARERQVNLSFLRVRMI